MEGENVYKYVQKEVAVFEVEILEKKYLQHVLWTGWKDMLFLVIYCRMMYNVKYICEEA